MKKHPEITDQTRQTFIDVFCELYSEKPIEQITVQEITRKAGYNRSTFYNYFCDVYALREYVENDVLDYISSQLRGLDTGDAESILREVIKLFEEKGDYLDALMGDYGSFCFQEKVKERIPLASGPYMTPPEDPRTPYLMEFNISTIQSLYRLWRKRGRDLPMEDLLNLIYRLYTGGISNL